MDRRTEVQGREFAFRVPTYPIERSGKSVETRVSVTDGG